MVVEAISLFVISVFIDSKAWKKEVIMKKILSILLFLIMMFPVYSIASDTAYISAYFDTQTQDVIISGTGEPGDIIITIADRDNSIAFSKQNPPYDIISVSNKDSYSVTLTLSDEASGKRLVATATDKSGTVSSCEFIYPDFDGSTSVIDELEDAASLSEFRSVAKSNALKLGFDTETDIYNSCEDNIYAIMYATKPSKLTAPEVYDLFYVSCALASFEGADSDEVDRLLSQNELYLGIDYDNDYASDERMDDSAKKALCRILSEEDFADALSDTETFADYFEKAKALANVKTADNWQDIKSVIEDDFSKLFDLESLSSSKSQQVYSKMMSYEYNDFDDIPDGYDKALKALKKTDGSSSSGGGGGGGKSSVSLPSSVDIVLSEDSETHSMGEKKPMATLSANASSSFGDVPSSHWSYQAVSSLCEAGIISGYDAYSFLPDNNITRAEFTKLVCASFGIPSLKADYTDVSADVWYNGYVGGASAYGIINGYGETFAPDSPITRQDAAVIVYRALKNEDIILNGSADFEDFNDISLYALTAVGAFKEWGILSGDGTNFYPLNNITRAEAAKLLFNALSVNN